MKRAKQMFAVLLCIAALCVLAPAALAAQPLDESENDGKVIIYFDACGGTGISVVERTNADGKLSSLPTPTMEGYQFDGWYDDVVGGTKITTRYNFKDDTTIYAHWTPTAKKNTATATAAKTTTTAPAAADTEKSWKLKDNLGTVLVVTAVVAVVVTVVAAQGS